MTISGYLENFSLPETFLIVDSGNRSGRLNIKVGLANSDSDLQGNFYIWFDRGNLVAITNSLQYESLITLIQNSCSIDWRSLTQAKYDCPENMALGDYLLSKSILSQQDLELLFKKQLDILTRLFALKSAWFRFEDMEDGNKNVGNNSKDAWQDRSTKGDRCGFPFPNTEMTGMKKRASQLSLEVMRSLTNWSRFEENLPAVDCGLQRIAKDSNLQLTPLEQHLWNSANGSVSLKTIETQMSVSLTRIRQTALSMIFAGLVEEIPVINSNFKTEKAPKSADSYNRSRSANVALKPKAKATVRNSLVKNIVVFLKNNF